MNKDIVTKFKNKLESDRFKIDELLALYNYGVDVETSMEMAEIIATKNVKYALNMMIDLYFVANEKYMHDVCDSIELWLCSEPYLSLNILNDIIDLPKTSHRVLVYKKWIKMMHNN